MEKCRSSYQSSFEYQLDVTAKICHLEVIGKVISKLAEWKHTEDDSKSRNGVLICPIGQEENLAFFGFGPQKREMIRNLNEGDLVRVYFKIQSTRSNSSITVLKIRDIKAIN